MYIFRNPRVSLCTSLFTSAAYREGASASLLLHNRGEISYHYSVCPSPTIFCGFLIFYIYMFSLNILLSVGPPTIIVFGKFLISFSLNRPTGPIQSYSRNVRLSVCLSVTLRNTLFRRSWGLLVEGYILNI